MRVWSGMVVWLFLMSLGSAEADDETKALLNALMGQVQDLKTQVSQAHQRIDDLEAQLQQAKAVPLATNPINTASSDIKPQTGAENATSTPPSKKQPLVTAGDVKGTFKVPGSETSVGLGGYIKTDLLFSSNSVGSDRLGDEALMFSQIPVGGAPGEHSQMAMHAKESRLWFKSFTPNAHWGDINTLIEMDFFGDPAAYTYTPRLRHAYGSIGRFLAGQTWTTFLQVAAIPENLDIGGSAGTVTLLRQPLIRWSQPFAWQGLEMNWHTALEAPRSRIWDQRLPLANGSVPNADNFFITANDDRYPDFVTRLDVNPEWGTLSLAAMVREIRYTRSQAIQRELWGGAVNFAGKINTVGLDNLRFMLHYGNAAGRYVATSNTFSDASMDEAGNMTQTTSYGGFVSYQHWWNKHWRSTVSMGMSRAEQGAWVNSRLTQEIRSLHANLLWSPISQAMFGVEYLYADRELIDGRDGDLQRLQFSARYNF
ncbi:MAG: hypothetical protein RL563_1018 [Pseudomonadota bacterium]